MSTVTAVLDVHGLHWATSAAVVESAAAPAWGERG